MDLWRTGCCDDFQETSTMAPQGSAGGCYLLPLSLPPECRRSSSSVRVISLTPPGVSTNEVLHFIVDDIVNETVDGVIGRTPSGNVVRIFLDVAGFIGDYPASSGTVDLLGYTASTPCTLCTFRRIPARISQGINDGYTCDAHANHSSFLRHSEIHNAMRKSNISDEMEN